MSFAVSAKQSSFLGAAAFTPAKHNAVQRGSLQVTAGMKEVRDRIASVKNTQKITEAMKLVAAAKVRRAQDAVIKGRPFSENLVKVLFGVNQRLATEDVDSPLCVIRPIKTVVLVVLSGDRGLCGGYNNFIIKKSEARARELTAMGIKVKLVTVGRKGIQYFKKREYEVIRSFSLGGTPTIKDAQGIADEIFADFVAGVADKVELVYTKFVSLINSQPVVQTLLPLQPSGKMCDINGNCLDAADDEVFKLTTVAGELAVEREKMTTDTAPLDPTLIFEQEPAQVLDALLPLYMNACLLRSLQEALASELAARMNAMSNATDNAKDLRKQMSVAYNRARQAKITSQISEICAGAAASS